MNKNFHKILFYIICMQKFMQNKEKKLLQYENLAEAAYYNFNLQEAIMRMDLAIKANDGDFYEKSRVESRLKQFQREQQFQTRDK